MNEKGVIYPYTALFSIFIFGIAFSLIDMYRTETIIYKEMSQIELHQSLLKMAVLLVESEDPFDSLQTEWKYTFNKGEVNIIVEEKNEERILLQINCKTTSGATITRELWYDRTNKKWYKS